VGANTTTGGAETLNREQFYREHRLQRTAFEIARDITEVLAGGQVALGNQPQTDKRLEAARLLFPQVLRVVEGYIERRVVLAVPGAHKEEIALAKYRDVILTRLLSAIEPDTNAGEAPILPRIERHRPVGSTADVQFRTTKATKDTWKSHISHVALDSPQWEGMAAFHLEQCQRVITYAKNDRLDFEILYDWQGAPHKYRPDYLVRIDAGDGSEVTLILEVKGYEKEQDRAKWAAAQKWVKAVNHHGGFGRWDLMLCKDPTKVRALLDAYVPRPAELVSVELSSKEMKRVLELNADPPAPTEILAAAWNRHLQ
jgi:type III restriction enzyme